MIDRLLKSEKHAETIEHFIIHEKYEQNVELPRPKGRGFEGY
jgi:hypothetical protein